MQLLIKALESWELRTQASKELKAKLETAKDFHNESVSARAFQEWVSFVKLTIKERKREKARDSQRLRDAFDALTPVREGRIERREVARKWGERRVAARKFDVLHGFVRALEKERDESFARKIKLAVVVERRIAGEAWRKWKEVVAFGEKERLAKEKERLAKARAKIKAREKNAIAINFACSNLLEKTIRFWRWETRKLAAERQTQAEKVIAEELEFRRDRERVRVKAWEEQKERDEFMRERSEKREKGGGGRRGRKRRGGTRRKWRRTYRAFPSSSAGSFRELDGPWSFFCLRRATRRGGGEHRPPTPRNPRKFQSGSSRK